eukprot:CAMPEP_0175160380 /NCGR_PEP_ID=MMETSP0087-20121206/23982_1 /TAXON_ID=136419 /ORGANISM="Unknown Unknown, Strain D1" /LENGTH=204 /DNA_ID=CAMNT_0016448607 /DNA_START=162 /DNA_END=772 /DNA_ORIENTATION=-
MQVCRSDLPSLAAWHLPVPTWNFSASRPHNSISAVPAISAVSPPSVGLSAVPVPSLFHRVLPQPRGIVRYDAAVNIAAATAAVARLIGKRRLIRLANVEQLSVNLSVGRVVVRLDLLRSARPPQIQCLRDSSNRCCVINAHLQGDLCNLALSLQLSFALSGFGGHIQLVVLCYRSDLEGGTRSAPSVLLLLRERGRLGGSSKSA